MDNTPINPATGTPYAPQVNMNGPATNSPGEADDGISAQPPVTTPAPAPQPDTPTEATPPPQD